MKMVSITMALHVDGGGGCGDDGDDGTNAVDMDMVPLHCDGQIMRTIQMDDDVGYDSM